MFSIFTVLKNTRRVTRKTRKPLFQICKQKHFPEKSFDFFFWKKLHSAENLKESSMVAKRFTSSKNRGGPSIKTN